MRVRAVLTLQGLHLQGNGEGGERKVCLEKGNRHVYGHATGLGAKESPREWATRWAPFGEMERMISNTVEEGSAWDAPGDWRE